MRPRPSSDSPARPAARGAPSRAAAPPDPADGSPEGPPDLPDARAFPELQSVPGPSPMPGRVSEESAATDGSGDGEQGVHEPSSDDPVDADRGPGPGW